jgi:hypothetical protein
MSYMEHSAANRPPAPDPRRAQIADADTDEQVRDLPHFRSLITPGLASGPILPEWLRRLFRRTTPSH